MYVCMYVYMYVCMYVCMYVALLPFQKAGRLGAILLRSVDDIGHPGGTTYPDAIRAQGIFSAHHPRSRRCNPAGLFGVRWE